MGRKRELGNERLGEGVQRRTGGSLELRFPIPVDVQHAFLDRHGRPRQTIIKSLGTPDVRIGNALADTYRAQVRDEILLVRSARASGTLQDYLQALYDQELANCQRGLVRDVAARRAATFGATPTFRPRDSSLVNASLIAHGAALASEDAAEVRAVAGWAADEYFRRKGQAADSGSPEYQAVLQECAIVLTDATFAEIEVRAGQPEPRPVSPQLRNRLGANPDCPNALTDRGRLPISSYFATVYAVAETNTGGAAKGERNISGKRHSVKMLSELIGDKVIGAITKGDLYQLLDDLLLLPDSRPLSGELKALKAGELLKRVKSGDLKLPPVSPKTANKHLANISSIMQSAERRRDIDKADSRGVKATIGEEESTGRSFTTAELNRIFALPLFSGCAGDDEEAGLFKAGPVLIRDDRFWIPLVLLFTGARSSEVVGMLTTEAVIDHEIPHLVIQANAVRRIKNIHSKRMVPIHPRLIAMGFIEFVKARQGEQDGRLFPMAVQEIYRDGATGESKPKALSNSLIMRQFNRTMLDHANAKADGGSIKCFRNTFEQESMAKIESDEMRQRLTGRKVISTSRIYTENVPYDPDMRTDLLVRLKGDLDKITYAAVKLDHLTA